MITIKALSRARSLLNTNDSSKLVDNISRHKKQGVDFMDIAALAGGLSQIKVAQEASVAVMKMAMDTAKSQSVDLIKVMENSVRPHVGKNVDIKL